MTREGENETPFAQNTTLLRISTSRKWRETLRFAQGKLLRLRSGQAPSAPLRVGSFDFGSAQAPSTFAQGRAMEHAVAPQGLKPHV